MLVWMPWLDKSDQVMYMSSSVADRLQPLSSSRTSVLHQPQLLPDLPLLVRRRFLRRPLPWTLLRLERLSKHTGVEEAICNSHVSQSILFSQSQSVSSAEERGYSHPPRSSSVPSVLSSSACRPVPISPLITLPRDFILCPLGRFSSASRAREAFLSWLVPRLCVCRSSFRISKK